MKTFMRRTWCVCNSCFHGDPLWFPNTHLTCKNSSETLFHLGKRTWVFIKTALRGCSEEGSLVSRRQPVCAKCAVARPCNKESMENWAKFSCRTSGVAHMSYLRSSLWLCSNSDLQMHSEKPDVKTTCFITVFSFLLRIFPVLNWRKL